MKAFFFLLAPSLAFSLSYGVDFIGLRDRDALNAMRAASDLISLQERPPASANGLRYRISSDIPSLLRVLQAFGYYDAAISSELENEGDHFQVSLFIHPGPQYLLSSYEVYRGDCRELAEIPPCPSLTPEQLGMQLGAPARSFDIVNGELEILTQLSRCGYPLAYVDKRRVIVDQETKKVEAAACVQEGPLSKFGPVTFFGLEKLDPLFIEKKVSWKEGEIYNSDLIAATQQRLLKTELFSSVFVSHGDELDPTGELPMKMRVTEAKHHSISLAAFYGTVDGPGLTFLWTDRNIGNMGEVLSAKGDFSKRYLAGNLTFKKPDFLELDQTYRALFEVARERIRAYHAFTYRIANYVEWPIKTQTRFSAGLKFDHIEVTKSANNGTYSLLGLPLFIRHDTSDSNLNPTSGYTLAYSITPYQSLEKGEKQFAKQRFTATLYLPLLPKTGKNVVLALRAQMGSIAGARREDIPLPKLFLGGSEDDLRGYRYKTVSPLEGNKPLGGRSAIFTSVEVRIRFLEKIALVPFADFGTVTLSEIPQVNAKWFKSVGGGIRYFAFFGPLRFDIGFPLDPRKGIDPTFQIYASVGQAF